MSDVGRRSLATMMDVSADCGGSSSAPFVSLSTIMIPFQAIVVPLFILMKDLGLNNTYLGLIVPESLTAFGVFLMRQFFYTLPKETIESARIDGANDILPVPGSDIITTIDLDLIILFFFRFTKKLQLYHI